MKKIQAVRQHIAAAIAMFALVLTVGLADATIAAHADTEEPDFLVLNPERE